MSADLLCMRRTNHEDIMLYLDIETLDFFQDPPIARLPRPVQLRAMRFGLATLYNDQAIPSAAWSQWWPADRHYPLGRVVWSDGPEEPGDLADLWRFLMNQTIVGWNIFDFDLPFLMLHVNAEADYPGDPWLDPMQIIDLMGILKHASKGFGRERWYKLQDISTVNLGRGKAGNGQEAAEWLRSGDPDLVRRAAAYCREDVQLVIELFQHAQTAGLLCPARPERNEVGDIRVWLDGQGTITNVQREGTM
jgi:hypothetical protein